MVINFLRALCVIFFAAVIGGGAFANSHLPPLHQAAGNGDIAAVSALIDGGADVNEKDKDGWTPLHIAADKGQTEIALALIKARADVNAKDEDGWTPLHSAAFLGQTEIALALIKAGADIHGTDRDGWTPLHLAACKGQTETIIALIHAGAYLKATDNKGNTALDVARQYKKWEAVSILENPPPPKPKASPPPSGESAPNVSVAPAPEDSNVAEFVFENAWRSVVFIRTKDGQGSGVIIKANIVATNCHVIDGGGIEVYKAHNRRTDESKSYSATLRRRDEKNDFCLLDVAGLWGVAANVRR